MRSPNRQTLSRRIVDALPVTDRETVYWDREVPGFGVRVHPSGSKVYMVHKRSAGKSRRVTIGHHKVWSLDDARREAGEIIARLRKGDKPGRPGADSPFATGPTIGELAEQYMTDHVAVRCKPTTARSCRHILDKFLLPEFGARRLGELTSQSGRDPALPPPGDADHGEPSDLAAFPALPQGRSIGRGPDRRQSVPVHPRSIRREAASAFCRSRNSSGWVPCSASSNQHTGSRRARQRRSGC